MTKLMHIIVALALVSMAACGGGSSSSGTGTTTLANASPGDTLPLNTTVRVSASGSYALPVQAQSVTTRCFGQVTLSIPGSQQPNTCRSATGSSQMTNLVSGSGSVTFTLGAGSFAQVTVN